MPDHVLDPYPALIKALKDQLADLETVVRSHETSIKLFLANNPALKTLREQNKKSGGTKEERAEALDLQLISPPDASEDAELKAAIQDYQARLGSCKEAERNVQRQKTEIERVENEFKVERYKLRETTSRLERESLHDELKIVSLRAETARLISLALHNEREFPAPIVIID